MAHDFVKFPELTNEQMQFYYFESPHKQILEDFTAKVVKVHDGDTVTVRWYLRDFDFPVRFSNIAAPELNERGGEDARKWLEHRVLNETVLLHVDPRNRVEKFGRLLATVSKDGIDVGIEEVALGLSTTWANRMDTKLPDLNRMIPELRL